MKSRPINHDDHELATKWWKAQKWPAVPQNVLPPTGSVVDGVCMGWVYLTNGGIAHAEWVVGNPDVTGNKKYKGIVAVLEHLVQIAKDNGNPIVFSSTKNEGLIRIMEKVGFNRSDEGMTNFLYTGA